MMQNLFVILVANLFVNNFLLSRFLGICSFIGVSKKVETSIGMGMAVVFVMTIASLATYLIQIYILNPLGIGFMQTIAFILIIASLVQLVEMVIHKYSPSLYQALGVFLPLITTNCAVLGAAIMNIDNNYNLIEAVFSGISAGLGYTLAIVLFAGIRERLETADIPKAFDGVPIAMIGAGLMSIAFLGFAGLI